MTTVTRERAASPADMLNWQAEEIKQGRYEYIGKAWCIVLEVSRDAGVPEPPVAQVLGSRLEFYGGGVPLGQSLDHSTLLLLGAVVRPDGSVGLPDIPDPTWKPPVPRREDIEGTAVFEGKGKKRRQVGVKGGNYTAPQAPMIPQKFEDRARGMLRGTDYYIFGPVVQVLIRPEGLPEGWIATCGADPATGTQMELLISRSTGRAHLYGGRFQISRVG